MTFKNAARFKGKISRLPATVAAACRAAMEESADEIVAAMKNLVPVETGALRDSINWCWGAPPADARLFTAISHKPSLGDNRISIFAGSYDVYWARWVEFGTRAHASGAYRDAKGRKRNAGARGHAATPAEPFFYPVWRAYKRVIPRRMAAKVNPAIKQLAQSQNAN